MVDGGIADVNGQGPGAGKAKSVVSGSNEQGGGAAYGGTGYETDSSFSQTYGSADLINHLLGDSGGGGGDLYPVVQAEELLNYLHMGTEY